jgi:DNA-binding winged helix-turn-helix (wHTH) protein
VERVQPEGIISAGPLTVDLSARRLVWNGDEVSVSPLLLALTAYLAARAGRLTPARTLLEDVWGEPWADLNKVHQAVYRLRHRLGEPGNSAFLIAKRGHGYGLFPETIESPSVDRRLAIHVKDSSWPSDLSRPGPATSRWLMMGRVAECEVIPGTPSNWGRRPGVSGCVDSP